MYTKNGHEANKTYEIRDVEGKLKARRERIDNFDEGKNYYWQQPDGTRGLNGTPVNSLPLYGSEDLPDYDPDELVVIAEGEQARKALAEAGIPSVGTFGTSHKPDDAILETLRGFRLALWPDADDKGRSHMDELGRRLHDLASEILLYTWDDAPDTGDAADHPAIQSGSRKEIGKLKTDLDSAPKWQPQSSSPSSSLGGSDSDDGARSRIKAVRFSDMEPAGKRHYVVEGLVPEGYPTIFYGDGGVAKSTLAMSLCMSVARDDADNWLGWQVQTAPVLYLDFELDASEQNRRVRQLARAEGLSGPPENLLYMAALGYRPRDAFADALEECIESGVKLIVLDSLGPALQGDAEAAKDVISFYQEVLEAFRSAGVSVLIVDHQAKGQPGDRYQSKRAFGSVFKGNLARSTVQIEAAERDENVLNVRLRQNKHNFGCLADPFGVKLTFSEEMVSVEATELDAAALAEEDTLNSTDRIRLALEDGSAFPDELAESTGLAIGTVKNALTKLRSKGLVESTGEMQGKAQQVRLASSSSSFPGDGDSDDGSDGRQRKHRTDVDYDVEPEHEANDDGYLDVAF